MGLFGSLEATTASKQPQRSNQTLDLKFVTQLTTYPCDMTSTQCLFPALISFGVEGCFLAGSFGLVPRQVVYFWSNLRGSHQTDMNEGKRHGVLRRAILFKMGTLISRRSFALLPAGAFLLNFLPIISLWRVERSRTNVWPSIMHVASLHDRDGGTRTAARARAAAPPASASCSCRSPAPPPPPPPPPPPVDI